jgi:hypothetical protein
VQLPKFTKPWTNKEKAAMENVLSESGKKFVEIARKVGTHSVAECIDRYYKLHLTDEDNFNFTMRKVKRMKRTTSKRAEESKVLASVTKVARHRYETVPRHDPSAWRFPPVSDERLNMVAPLTARDFSSGAPLPFTSEDSLKGKSKPNGHNRVYGNVHASPVQPYALANSAGLDDTAETMSLSPPGSLSFGDMGAGNLSQLGVNACLATGAALSARPLAGLQPLPPSASLHPLPEIPVKNPFPKVRPWTLRIHTACITSLAMTSNHVVHDCTVVTHDAVTQIQTAIWPFASC